VIVADDLRIEEWRPDADDADLDALADVLHAVVHDGAAVSFVVPFSIGESRAFWADNVLPGVRAAIRRVIVAVSTAASSALCRSILRRRRTSSTAPRC
jgi:hypothetical protein